MINTVLFSPRNLAIVVAFSLIGLAIYYHFSRESRESQNESKE